MDLQAKDRDGNIVHVFDNYEFGYRTNFDLCSGGLIEVTSSVSAAEYDVVFIYHLLIGRSRSGNTVRLIFCCFIPVCTAVCYRRCRVILLKLQIHDLIISFAVWEHRQGMIR